MSLMTKVPSGKVNMQDLWFAQHLHRIRHAGHRTGHAGKYAAHDDQIFLAGMLHDIGYLVLAYLDPKLSDKLHTRWPQNRSVRNGVEREILDTCHDELGRNWHATWNLPEEIIAVLRYHHSPDADGAAVDNRWCVMINITESCCRPLC